MGRGLSHHEDPLLWGQGAKVPTSPHVKYGAVSAVPCSPGSTARKRPGRGVPRWRGLNGQLPAAVCQLDEFPLRCT